MGVFVISAIATSIVALSVRQGPTPVGDHDRTLNPLTVDLLGPQQPR